jgi:hypothetical protein
VVGQFQSQSLFDNGNFILDSNAGSDRLGFRWPGGSGENQIALNNVASTGTVSQNTFYQIGVKKNSSGTANADFRISRTAAGSPSVGSTSSGANQIAISGTNLKLRGDIAALIVYNAALISTDITTVETYLNGKYGV